MLHGSAIRLVEERALVARQEKWFLGLVRNESEHEYELGYTSTKGNFDYSIANDFNVWPMKVMKSPEHIDSSFGINTTLQNYVNRSERRKKMCSTIAAIDSPTVSYRIAFSSTAISILVFIST